MKGTLYFDGACRGNPGPMAGGAILQIGTRVHEICGKVRRGTNNEAEYWGLIEGLEAALAAGVTDVTVHGDSQLILRQLEGNYQVKAANLRPLFDKAKQLCAKFSSVEYAWVPRDQNARADQAANRALDRA